MVVTDGLGLAYRPEAYPQPKCRGALGPTLGAAEPQPPDDKLKPDIFLFICLLPHLGQAGSASFADLARLSNLFPHFPQLYSYIGITVRPLKRMHIF